MPRLSDAIDSDWHTVAQAQFRVRQHHVAQHVVERFTCDGDQQLGATREVRLHRVARLVVLREEDLLLLALERVPVAHLPLQCPQLPLVVPLWVLLEQPFEDGLRLQLGRLL
jgi:hypothetical protein